MTVFNGTSKTRLSRCVLTKCTTRCLSGVCTINANLCILQKIISKQGIIVLKQESSNPGASGSDLNWTILHFTLSLRSTVWNVLNVYSMLSVLFGIRDTWDCCWCPKGNHSLWALLKWELTLVTAETNKLTKKFLFSFF